MTLDVPPAFSIFSLRRRRDAVRLDRELLGELALAEDLHALDELRDEALGRAAPSRSTVAPASNSCSSVADVDRERPRRGSGS